MIRLKLSFHTVPARRLWTASARSLPRRKTIVGSGNWSKNDPGGIIKGRPAGPVNVLKERATIAATAPSSPSTSTERLSCNMNMDGQMLVKTNDEDGGSKSFTLGCTARTAKSTRCQGTTDSRDDIATRSMLMLN
ncbi:hypothetical protein H632_c1615p0 [Helicosporidium sp. ATCC 50920]|nr:hypothetical protein H632_c1615p0 [Helicosporidium sp. ATCC 50920]|eukprot:KDD74054.1 hypothetical protein H632_c1615p0 [Helicosporidium sp. ATCC 50920]